MLYFVRVTFRQGFSVNPFFFSYGLLLNDAETYGVDSSSVCRDRGEVGFQV